MRTESLTCPYCQSDYVHLENVLVNRGGEITRIKHDGTRLSASTPSGRGACVELTLFCENGHEWKNTLQFHKGTLTSENRLLSEDAGHFSHDLWRD